MLTAGRLRTGGPRQRAVATIISRKYNAFEIAKWLNRRVAPAAAARLGNRVQISGMPPRRREHTPLAGWLRRREKGEIVSPGSPRVVVREAGAAAAGVT